MWISIDPSSADDFTSYYHGTFSPTTVGFLDDLAEEYYRRTEAYDLAVCTGPMGCDGILPATRDEFNLINRNAIAILRELNHRALVSGYTFTELRTAMMRYNHEGR